MRSVVTNLPTSADGHEWRPDAVDEHLVCLLDPSSFVADQYRTLCHVVERQHATKRAIAVTSAAAGEGKTTTAINLAAALACAPEARILICDLDMRTPSLGKRLGLTAEGPGLTDLLLDPSLRLDDVARRHPRFPLSVLRAGRAITMPYELLKSSRLGDLLQAARRQYDHVVLDTPPFVPVPDSQLIADCVDGVVMVVTAHHTPRQLVEDALNLMDPTKLIGIIFNGDDLALAGYYGYFYGRGRQPRRWRNGREIRVMDKAVSAFQLLLGYARGRNR